MTDDLALRLALKSLDGLSVGDAFGELFFRYSPYKTSFADLPPGPWSWTDDTHMAFSIVEILKTYGRIDQDALANTFARRYIQDPRRGYGSGAHHLLKEIALGGNWRTLAPTLFGNGSYGNGAAMRAAPIGGFFHNDLDQAITEARASAMVTHAHLEGQAGAIAVAVAAVIAASHRPPTGNDFLKEVIQLIPDGITHAQTEVALQIPAGAVLDAIRLLGAGEKVAAQDTVPFCLWSAAHHLNNYEAALWNTAKGLGDVDTTCAIVGGIVALSAHEIPKVYLERREPLNL